MTFWNVSTLRGVYEVLSSTTWREGINLLDRVRDKREATLHGYAQRFPYRHPPLGVFFFAERHVVAAVPALPGAGDFEGILGWVLGGVV